jgi:hypothetical protein
VRVCCGRVIEESLTTANRELLVAKGYLRRVITTAATKLNKSPEQQRLSLALMDSMFKHSTDTSSKVLPPSSPDPAEMSSKLIKN